LFWYNEPKTLSHSWHNVQVVENTDTVLLNYGVQASGRTEIGTRLMSELRANFSSLRYIWMLIKVNRETALSNFETESVTDFNKQARKHAGAVVPCG